MPTLDEMTQTTVSLPTTPREYSDSDFERVITRAAAAGKTIGRIAAQSFVYPYGNPMDYTLQTKMQQIASESNERILNPDSNFEVAGEACPSFEVPVMVPCKVCSKLLPLSTDNFYRNPTSLNGYRSTCIPCHVANQNEKRAKAKEKKNDSLSTLITKLEKDANFRLLIKEAIYYIESK